MEIYLKKVLEIWFAGGWTMIPLALVGLSTYWSAMGLFMYFARRDHKRVPERVWRDWVRNPDKGQGELGEIIRYTQDECKTPDDVQDRFAEVVVSKIPEINRRLAFMNVMVNAAPLLGLLGTVLGMLSTFQAIASGGQNAMSAISSGISEALITTEVGLMVALPGMMLIYFIRRKRDEYEAFLASLESATVQHFRGKDGDGGSAAAAVQNDADESEGFMPMPQPAV